MIFFISYNSLHFILPVFIVILYWIFNFKKADKDLALNIFNSIWVYFCSFILVLLILMTIDFITTDERFNTEAIYDSKNISAMNDEYNNSRFAIYSGSYINIITENNGIKYLEPLPAENCRIVEDNKKELIIYKKKKKGLLGFILGSHYMTEEKEKCYELHIPENSLTTEFKIDLE